jgi:hypothetical protein
MLAKLYIEALLVDEELADLVWECWDAGEVDNVTAWSMWWSIFNRSLMTTGEPRLDRLGN